MIGLNLTYTEREDGMMIPDLALPEQPEVGLGRFARMREGYLKTEKKAVYTSLLTQCKLATHLSETEQTAKERVRLITGQRAKALGVDAGMKKTDPMKWAALMTNIRLAVEQEVIREMILA